MALLENGNAAGLIALMVFPFLCRRLPGKAGHYLGRAVLIVARSPPEYTVAYVLPQRLGPSMLPAIIATRCITGRLRRCLAIGNAAEAAVGPKHHREKWSSGFREK